MTESWLASEILLTEPRERVPVVHDVILNACGEAGWRRDDTSPILKEFIGVLVKPFDIHAATLR